MSGLETYAIFLYDVVAWTHGSTNVVHAQVSLNSEMCEVYIKPHRYTSKQTSRLLCTRDYLVRHNSAALLPFSIILHVLIFLVVMNNI